MRCFFFLTLVALFALARVAPARGEDWFEFDGDFSISPRCEKFYEPLGIKGPVLEKQTLEVQDWRNEKFARREIPDARKDAIYIGIANNQTNDEGIHHYYLVAGKKRLEASPVFGKVEGKGGVFSAGVVFEVPAPPEVVNQLEARLKGKSLPRGITCLHVLCKVLDEAGVVINGVGHGNPVSSKVAAASLMQGKVQIRGEAVDPATMRLFESHEGELRHYLENAISADEVFANRIKTHYRNRVLLVVGAGGAVTFVLVGRHFTADEPAPKSTPVPSGRAH